MWQRKCKPRTCFLFEWEKQNSNWKQNSTLWFAAGERNSFKLFKVWIQSLEPNMCFNSCSLLPKQQGGIRYEVSLLFWGVLWICFGQLCTDPQLCFLLALSWFECPGSGNAPQWNRTEKIPFVLWIISTNPPECEKWPSLKGRCVWINPPLTCLDESSVDTRSQGNSAIGNFPSFAPSQARADRAAFLVLD